MICEKEKTNDEVVKEVANDNFKFCQLMSFSMSKDQFHEVVGADEKTENDEIDPEVLRTVSSLSEMERGILLAVIVARDEDRFAKVLDLLTVEQKLFIYGLLRKFDHVGQ